MNDPQPSTTGEDLSDAIQSISDWIVRQALVDARIGPLFQGLCERLVAAGLPLVRGHLALPTLHPMFESMTVTWWQGRGIQFEQIPHGSSDGIAWQQSPLNHMLMKGATNFRHRLQEDAADQFPLLVELRDRGLTDYLAMLTPFRSMHEALHRRDGMIASWSTDRPQGFGDHEVAALRRLQLRLGLAVKMALREQTASNVVAAYLGPDAGRRVLDGQIHLGDAQHIHAVVWYSDLRDSVAIAHRLTSDDFLAALNAYFACTAGAVLDHGGQVLRFIGDAVLAIFPANGPGGDAQAARTAMAAARDAQSRAADLNAARWANKLPLMEFGLALHLGDLMYGNIGVPERLEFTVIGRVANEVCRLETMTKQLRESILVSETFARCLPIEWRSHGRHRLRGVGDDMEVLAPPEQADP